MRSEQFPKISFYTVSFNGISVFFRHNYSYSIVPEQIPFKNDS